MVTVEELRTQLVNLGVEEEVVKSKPKPKVTVAVKKAVSVKSDKKKVSKASKVSKVKKVKSKK